MFGQRVAERRAADEERYALSPAAYLERYGVALLLEEAAARGLAAAAGGESAVDAAAQWLAQAARGTHVVGREWAFTGALPRNRRALLEALRPAVAKVPAPLCAPDWHALVQLLCPDAPAELTAAAVGAEGGSHAAGAERFAEGLEAALVWWPFVDNLRKGLLSGLPVADAGDGALRRVSRDPAEKASAPPADAVAGALRAVPLGGKVPHDRVDDVVARVVSALAAEPAAAGALREDARAFAASTRAAARAGLAAGEYAAGYQHAVSADMLRGKEVAKRSRQRSARRARPVD